MQSHIIRLSILAALLFPAAFSLKAQEPTSIDPKLIEWRDARIPKEYVINSITITGVVYYDTAIIASISGLQVGQRIMHPGGDQFAKAISNLWRQKLFSDIEIYVTGIQGDRIDVEIHVQERPRLSKVYFNGIRKSEADELQGKTGMVPGTVITENGRRNAVEAIKKFYTEKGFQNAQVQLEEQKDPSLVNSNSVTFHIVKGQKVRINEVNFYGNTSIPDLKLKKQMKGTKERTKLTIRPAKDLNPYGTTDERMSFGEYIRDLGFLSLTKTKILLDPYFRFKLFSSAKFDQKKYEEDKRTIIDYYNSVGYRDATIEEDTMYYNANGNLNIALKVDEGTKYYFGDIAWKGNTKYTDSLLSAILGIQKGDIYNLELLNQRMGKQLTPEGGDISGLYMDDGYLFFQINAVETAVYNDTIDHEIRVVEGPQARIGEVNIYGNDKTKDYVIRRELRTVPGDLFSRSDLIRSQRELANLQYFNQETINPGVVPHQEDGTVDINWQLEEKSSDQLELSAGWGGGIGLTGTLGVTFNNFSIKNILKRSSWDPLPSGDGQKLSLRLQSNGRAFRSYNFSFTEPWLGGKKRNALTISFFNSKFSNAFDPLTGRILKERADSSYLRTLSLGVSLAKQLRWPDDYFSLVYALNFTQYKLKDYPIFQGLRDGTSTNISLKLGLQRSSVFNPIFPTSGSSFMASVQLTPPYSLFNPDLVTAENPYKNPEYHKWRFNAEWYVPIGRPKGEDNSRQLVLKMAAKYGFMGRYNRDLDFSPFERFQVGDAGLTNNFGLLGYDIIAHRGYPVYESSNPSVNPDQQNAQTFFTIFNKYQLELRYPLVTNPGSTIYGLAFFEAANGWYDFKEYNPFRLRRSAGIGMRFFLPMFGLLGFDYGIGFDRMQPGETGLKNAGRFTFMLGFEPE